MIVSILDFTTGSLNIIRLTRDEIDESKRYSDFEAFLVTLEGKYGFRLSNCQWMVTEELDLFYYDDGSQAGFLKLN